MSRAPNPRSGSATPAIRAPKYHRQQRTRLVLPATWVMTLIGQVRLQDSYTSLVYSECGVERLNQSPLAERLEQTPHGALFEHSRADGLISVSGDEDDRNLFPAKFQFSLEIRSCHARHGDVQDQTPSLVDVIRREELFRRRERMGRKAQLAQQVG